MGETPDRVLNHPDLQGMDIPNTGYGTSVAPMTVTATMLLYAGNGSSGTPYLYAADKATGEQLGKIEVPAQSRYGMMTYSHEGKQYIVLLTGSKLTAMAIYDEASDADAGH